MALDVRHWNATFLNHYANYGTPFRQREKYDITIRRADVKPGETYWACIGVKHLTGVENRGNHNIYCDVLDSAGHRVRSARLRMKQETQNPVFAIIDKPDNEPGTNFPIWNGDVSCEVSVVGRQSDVVAGVRTNHKDENGGNTIGHHSFYIVWKEVLADDDMPQTKPPATLPDGSNGETIIKTESLTIQVDNHQVDILVVIREV